MNSKLNNDVSRPLTRRFFLSSVAASAVLGTQARAEPPTASLRPVLRGEDFYKRAVRSVEEIIRSEKLSGQVAFAVADAKTGRWLECAHEREGTPPASVTKAITALYALDALGEDHQFETRLCATGGIVDGEVQGDLILIGGGDPTLDTDGLAEMAAQLKEAGVQSVKGGFKVFEASLPVLRQIDPEQPDHVGYNPGVSGIALNFNRVHFEWKRASGAYTVTMDARSEKVRPAVSMAVMQIKDRSAPIYTYEDRANRDNWTVAKGALGSGGSRWLPVRKPGLYAGEVFTTMAGAQGIRLSKPEIIGALPMGDLVVTRTSGDLRSILRDMLRFSTNLTAEMVGLAASTKRLGTVADLRASAAEMNRWAIENLDMVAPKLVDHSGLGDDSTVTALDMATALIKVRDSGLRPILKPFGMRDEKGRPVKDHPMFVQAKTGTLNFVSALAGYVTAKDGTELVFAIFAADAGERAKITRALREGPPGAQTWNKRAKRVQQALIERWGVMYGV
jgi:D-alanyl-D-alanine carboxypeptidase/D-alanyl-D-alanine-endopeptidase (penicillin-binding protein 4)